MRLRIGIVGLGNGWETRYVPALRALAERFDVKAICDPVAHRANQAAAMFSAKPERGFRTLVGREDVDAGFVLSGELYGALPIYAACDAGKGVYCGVARDLSDDLMRAVRDRVQTSGIAFFAEYPARHAPATLRLKELIATRLGPPRLLLAEQRRLDGSCRNQVEREVVERVDWCRYLIDREPHWALADWSPLEADVSDGFCPLIILRWDAGDSEGDVSAQIRCGPFLRKEWKEAKSYRSPADLQIVCGRGIAYVDLPDRIVWFDEAGQHTESLGADRPVVQQMLLAFHRQVTNLLYDSTNVNDAYRSIAITYGILNSANDQGRVEIGKSL